MGGMGKVIRLDERLSGVRAGFCRRCKTRGAVDYVDLVAQRAKLHCPACSACWDEDTAVRGTRIAGEPSRGA